MAQDCEDRCVELAAKLIGYLGALQDAAVHHAGCDDRASSALAGLDDTLCMACGSAVPGLPPDPDALRYSIDDVELLIDFLERLIQVVRRRTRELSRPSEP
jgi:hypothetical protein